MALHHGRLLDAYFIRPFYKSVLQLPITLDDVEAFDADYHRNLKYILNTDGGGEILCATFSLTEQMPDGSTTEVELKPGGEDIDVTDDNKKEYIDLVLKHKFCDSVRHQMNELRAGLDEVLPLQQIAMFDPYELELLVGGIDEIDSQDWYGDIVLDHFSSRAFPKLRATPRALWDMR